MDNPIKEVTTAAKSALTLRNILVLLIGFLLLAVIADVAGITGWLFQPVTTFKAWNKERQAKAKTA